MKQRAVQIRRFEIRPFDRDRTVTLWKTAADCIAASERGLRELVTYEQRRHEFCDEEETEDEITEQT